MGQEGNPSNLSTVHRPVRGDVVVATTARFVPEETCEGMVQAGIEFLMPCSSLGTQ